MCDTFLARHEPEARGVDGLPTWPGSPFAGRLPAVPVQLVAALVGR